MRGDELTRSERLDLIRAAERTKLGFEVPRHKVGDIDLSGAIAAGGGEIDIQPGWWLEGADAAAADQRVAKVKRSGRGNSATFALCESFARTYGEPALHVFRGPYMDLERSERLDDHPLAQGGGILRVPNRPALITMTAIQRALAAGKLVGGDFYLVKARSGGGTVQSNTTGAVVRLWPVWPSRMWPEMYGKTDTRASTGWIDYYAYDVGRGRPVEIPPENVIHFRNGMRDDNPRLGIGVVEEFAEEVGTDIEAALLVRAVLTNLGIPGLVFSPDDSGAGSTGGAKAGIGRDDREQIKASVMAKTTGARRGEPIVLSRPTRFEQFQVDLEQYNLAHVWTHVETRISAVVGWPAILAGLQAGLDAATYANVASLRRFATENAAVPTWEDDSETWTLALRDDVGLRPDEWIAYDYRTVRALQEDRATVAKEALEAFVGNAITVGQYHERIGAALPEGVDPAMRRADIEKGMGGGVTINVPGATGETAPVAVGTEEAVQAAEREAASISAAKIGELRSYAEAVATGTIERGAAVAQIMYTYNVTKDQAEAFLGSAAGPSDVVARLAGGKIGAPPGAKAVERFTPPAGDEPLTADELDEPDLTPEDVSEALVRMADRLAEAEPDLAGILGAVSTEPEEDEKRRPFPVRAKADPRSHEWVWHPGTQRYRWPGSNHAVPAGRIFRAREKLIEGSRERMRGIAERYTNGEITLSQMQKQMRREYTDQHITMRALGRGGERQLTRADREAIGAMVKRENKYLAGFARDIADGKLSEAQILDRAQKYAGASMRQQYAAGRLTGHAAAGFTKKRRSGPNDERTCSTCAEEIGRGSVPIDEPGFVLGETKCVSNDRCEILFEK